MSQDKLSRQITLTDMTPQLRAWLSSHAQQIAQQTVDKLSMELQQQLAQAAYVANNGAVRAETLLHALLVKGVLSEAELTAAHQDLLKTQEEVRRLRTLPHKDRAEALLKWNESGVGIKVKPHDVELHEWLLDPVAELTREERRDLAVRLGFGKAFLGHLAKRFGGVLLEDLPAAESPPSELPAAEKEEEEESEAANLVHLRAVASE